MKQILCMIMAVILLSAMLGACAVEEKPSPKPEQESTAPEETAAAEEPSVSQEAPAAEKPASRRDAMAEAVQMGLIPAELENTQKVSLTVGEVSQILQAAFVYRSGVRSKTLDDLAASETYAGKTADLGWMGSVIALADMELIRPYGYSSYGQWWNQCSRTLFSQMLGDMSDGQFATASYRKDPDTGMITKYPTQGGINAQCGALARADKLYAGTEFGDGGVISYAWRLYDKTTGLRLLDPEAVYEADATRPVTPEEVAEFALRYANAVSPKPEPDWVDPEDVKGFDPDIISPELLTKETTLPEASCENLPAQWHGIVMEDLAPYTLMGGGDSYGMTDREIYEYEIQAIQDAGFNFIGLNVDFSFLQRYDLFGVDYYRFRDRGELDENMLKKLDQILAWCMERDIHLNIRCTGIAGCENNREQVYWWNKINYYQKYADVWQALARRYDAIPNTYLSFTLFSGDHEITDTEFQMEALKAIREETPDRCIIAEILRRNISAEAFAKKGVALSFGLRNPQELFSRWEGLAVDAEKMAAFTWPYQGEVDAEALLDQKNSRGAGDSANQVMTVAEEYGVGFMLSDFGLATGTNDLAGWWLPVRIPEEAFRTMLEEITSVMAQRGYGWCFAHAYGSCGLMFGYPIIEATTYRQIENYPCYVDEHISGWFREINSIS